ncbi:MAG: efflux RND transporter periplasmic adaptor subunit [Emcibacter sp.]|nr:efflux RND transporter periplasmic adaptor subunit [Emcibacter sp.]
MKNSKIIIILLLVVVVIAGWYLTRKRPLLVEVAFVEQQVPVKVFGLGTVEARIASKIGFTVSNAITELNVDAGDQVRQGDVLARLSNAEQKARLIRAEAGVLAAEAAIKGAGSGINNAKAVVAKRASTNKRQRALYLKGTISEETAEQYKLELDIAKTDLEIARSNLLAAEAALDNARAQLELEKVTFEQHTLKAPYDAVIVARHKELGSVVKAGEALFTLVDPDTVWVLGHISESRSGLISLGQPVEIRLRSRPHDLFRGTVQRIDIESDRVTEERQVYASCAACMKNFNLGEQAEIYVQTAILDKALLVPENAVDDFDERQMRGTVWVLLDGELKRQNVIFGHRTLDARLSIIEGLPEKARVLTRLPKLLKEGRHAKAKTEKSS